jgi:hypothetical protein
MSHKARAATALHDAEKRLREIASDALAEGDYASVDSITQWAKVLSDLQPKSIADIPEKPSSRARPLVSGSSSETNLATTKERPMVATETNAAAFPRFERHSKRLVKLGWSSRDKRIYEHRASYDAAEEICKRFVEKAGNKKILKIEKVLPMKTEDGEELPSYQVYLVLKWLQHHGVVEKQGKDGYLIADPDFSFKSIWETTPAK